MMSNDIEWKMVKLGDVCQIKDGTHQTPHYVENGKQFYSVENVTNNDFSHTKYISESEHKKLTATYRIEKGDVLMTRIGSIGVCKYIDWDVDASFYVSLALLKCNKTFINPRYFVFYSQTKQFREEILSHSLQFAIPMKINLGKISDVLISIPYKNGSPDLETQKQIAQKLGDMDSLIAAKEKLLAKKRNLKVAAMQKLLPRDTTEVKLKDCVNFVNGIAHENFVSELGEYILVNSKFISTEGRVVKYSSKQLLPIEEHSILMVMSDVPNGKAIGKCFYVPNSKFKGTLNQRICMLKVKDGIDSEFLFRLLNRNKYFLAFDDGVKQTNLRKSDVLGCPIPLPEYTEQCRIASILSDMDSEISAIEKEITKLQNLKTAMMQKMFCFEDSDSSSE